MEVSWQLHVSSLHSGHHQVEILKDVRDLGIHSIRSLRICAYFALPSHVNLIMATMKGRNM
jgi:hypothetical protein